MHTHICTHTFVLLYVSVCVCLCVCVFVLIYIQSDLGNNSKLLIEFFVVSHQLCQPHLDVWIYVT